MDKYTQNKIKHTASIINNGSMNYKDKVHELNLIFDTIYMDGYNAGAGITPVTEQDERVVRTKGQVAV